MHKAKKKGGQVDSLKAQTHQTDIIRLTVALPHIVCVSAKKLHLSKPQILQPMAN